MKAVMKIATYLAVASVALLAVTFMLDLMSLQPAYDLADAVVVNVQPDTKWGYIDEDWRTLVQFADGYRDYAPGALGEPGDALKVERQNGTMSLFGWTGDRQW